MSVVQVYSVLDKAVGAFLPPFYSRAAGEAVRSFSDAVNDPAHQFNKHMLDYELCRLGSFDDVSGVFSGSGPERVVSALECVYRGDDVAPGGKGVANGGVVGSSASVSAR